ncbi:hypothetical protein ACP70R_037182 [Stipagrostis hirtigluma subsp. patula]
MKGRCRSWGSVAWAPRERTPLDDGDAGVAVISHAFHRGVTFFDTADAYGSSNKTLLGKARPGWPLVHPWFLESSRGARAWATRR